MLGFLLATISCSLAMLSFSKKTIFLKLQISKMTSSYFEVNKNKPSGQLTVTVEVSHEHMVHMIIDTFKGSFTYEPEH